MFYNILSIDISIQFMNFTSAYNSWTSNVTEILNSFIIWHVIYIYIILLFSEENEMQFRISGLNFQIHNF